MVLSDIEPANCKRGSQHQQAQPTQAPESTWDEMESARQKKS